MTENTEIDMSIANVTPQDLKSFNALKALFTDPALTKHLAEFRAGKTRLFYNHDGSAYIQDPSFPTPHDQQRN